MSVKQSSIVAACLAGAFAEFWLEFLVYFMNFSLSCGFFEFGLVRLLAKNPF